MSFPKAKDEACYSSTSCSNDAESQWFLDNGYTNHMATNKSIFVNMKDVDSKVRLGNGAFVDVKRKGTIGVQTKKGSRFICGVLYVPDLDPSLLSVGQLVENGYSLHFEDNCCTNYDKGNQKMILASLKMENQSFLLNFKYSSDKAFKVDVSSD